MHRELKIFQRDASLHADLDSDGRFQRDGNSDCDSPARRRQNALRHWQPAFCIVLRFVGGALDEEAHVPLPRGRAGELSEGQGCLAKGAKEAKRKQFNAWARGTF